jgi:hypothetical protein
MSLFATSARHVHVSRSVEGDSMIETVLHVHCHGNMEQRRCTAVPFECPLTRVMSKTVHRRDQLGISTPNPLEVAMLQLYSRPVSDPIGETSSLSWESHGVMRMLGVCSEPHGS